MARINITILTLTATVAFLMSCKPSKLVQDVPTPSWKESLIYRFIDEYVAYQDEYKIICQDERRDYYFDFVRKIQSIREYPFDAVLKGIQKFVNLNKIEFDSVLMENISDPIYETIDYSCPNTYFSFIN